MDGVHNPRGFGGGYGRAFTFATRGPLGDAKTTGSMQAVDVAISRAARAVSIRRRWRSWVGSTACFMDANWIVGHTNRFRVAAKTDRSIFNWYSWYGSSDDQGEVDE